MSYDPDGDQFFRRLEEERNNTAGKIQFEQTGLPDVPALRTAFNDVALDVLMTKASNPHLSDDGLSPASMKLRLRAAEILREALPDADAEQIAGALLFLTYGFGQPVLMERGRKDELPKVAAWSKEWRRVQTGQLSLSSASLELRQIVTAVNTALLEGEAKNFAALRPVEVRMDTAEKEYMFFLAGDLQAPLLADKFQQARAALKQQLDSPRPPSP